MVFVLDRYGKPLMPCSEKRARLLFERNRARVHHLVPFVIRLIDRTQNSCSLQKLRIQLDPGSRFTGVALVREKDTPESIAVLNLFELIHRGRKISEALTARRQMRRRRRNQLRYRAPRFLNRGNKQKGWIAPSLQHRVDTTMSFVQKMMRWIPITGLRMEKIRFDMQKLQNPEISGVEYQQGTLLGYEIREYLLEKFGRKCVYCNCENVPLEIEHMEPKSNGGSDRISNLTLACRPCNQKKGSQSLEVFLKKKPDLLKKLQTLAKKSLRDAAAVNTTRNALHKTLETIGLPVETSTGGRTKFNRSQFNIPKDHALDAACVGELSDVSGWKIPTLQIKCMGRGSYQRTRLTKYGFPRGYLERKKSFFGFQTGDLVTANVTKGLKIGKYTGRVAVRATGSFNLQTPEGVVQGISHRFCQIVQRADGYGYSLKI